MIGLDTNVLVRYLTQDDPVQAARAGALLTDATARGGRCYVSAVVLCELVWVLREAYQQSKPQIVDTLDRILSTRQFEIGDKDVVRAALDTFRSGRGDFADYVIGEMHRAAGCDGTATFDRRLGGAPGFRLL